MERLQEIKERLENITQGEWRTPPSFSGVTTQSHGDICYRGNGATIHDILFIVFAPEDIRYLLRQHEANHREIQGLKANSLMLEHIIESGSNPADKDKIVSLVMENASLKSQLTVYKEAEEQGRLVVLPCDTDKTCYAITQLNCETTDCPKQDEKGDCKHDCPNIVSEIKLQELLFVELLGLRLFSTREEAEVALKEEGAAHE